jgi:hypothetical protein
MKKFNTSTRTLLGITALLTIIALTSCENNPSRIRHSSAPPVLDHVSVVHVDSATTEGTRGESVVIIGKNLESTRSITFNGADAHVNLALATKHNIIVSIPDGAPFRNASDSLVVTNGAGSASLPFKIVPPPPTVESFSPSAGPAGQIVTIKGHVFDGVDTVQIGDMMTKIVSSDTNQVKVKVPKGGLFGKISVTTPGGTSATKHPFGFKYKIYGDALNANFANYSYGGTATLNNTEHVAAGKYSAEMQYAGGYAAFLPHYTGSTPFDLTKYSTVKISIYGGQNLGSVSIFFDTKSDNQYHVKLDVEKGKYKTFYVPLSKLGNPKTFTQFFVQDGGTVTNFTIYIDNLGFY